MLLILSFRSRVNDQLLRLSQFLVLFWLSYLTSVNSQCPPSDSQMKVITSYMTQKLNDIRKYKPGINPKDADWVINRVVKDISTNNKFAPCNNGFPWEQVEEDSNQIRNDCYKPNDYTKPGPQREILECSKKYYPQFLLRYGKLGIDSCNCFSKYIVPNWNSRYKKYANDYVEEFKTLKHRRKK